MKAPHALPGEDLVVGGLRMHLVRREGTPGRSPLLLLHGIPTSGRLWQAVLRDLPPGLGAIAPDLPGLGRSERPATPLDLAQQAAQQLALLDVLGHSSAVVVGHDIGGAVAVHLAALAPERVAGLVLVSSPLRPETWPPARTIPLLLPGVRTALLRGVRLQPDGIRRLLGRALGLGPDSVLTASELDGYLAPLLGPERRAGLLDLIGRIDLAAAERAWEGLRAAPPRTLVLWGTDDPLYGLSYGRRIADQTPGAAWVPVSGAGHLLPHERPERVAEELAGFVGDLPALAS